MISKARISLIRSLRNGKFRKKNNLFICEGPKLTEDIIRSKFNIEALYCLGSWADNNSILLQSKDINAEIISEKELKQISSLITPNEVIALVEIPRRSLLKDTLLPGIKIILDDIRDPGNLGTIIRLADWFGIGQIICSKETVDLYNPKAVQSTMGSIARVNVYYEDLQSLLQDYSDKTKIYGTRMDGKNIYTTTLDANAFVVIGNESNGISKNLEPFIDNYISIPAFKEGAESLNASMATAVIISEFRRNEFYPNKT